MQEFEICKKMDKVGKPKKQEIRNSMKSEEVGNQKNVGSRKKKEIRKIRKSEKVGSWDEVGNKKKKERK